MLTQVATILDIIYGIAQEIAHFHLGCRIDLLIKQVNGTDVAS